MRHVFVTTMTGAYLSLSLLAGTAFGQRERPKDVQPAPRWPDGRVNIASVPGQKGHWIRTRRELVVDAKTTNTLPDDRKIEEIPFSALGESVVRISAIQGRARFAARTVQAFRRPAADWNRLWIRDG